MQHRAPVGAPATSYLLFTYVNALPGSATKTWPISMPATLGQYEFRLYLNNSYTIAATSPPVTVASISPTPTITTLAPAGVAAGSAGFSLAVSGSGFVAGAAATVGGQSRSVTVGSATQLAIAVLAADIASQGNVPVQITNPAACVGGLCASNTVNLVVTPPPPAPALAVSAPNTLGGQSITTTLTNAPGGASDWLGLAAVGTPSTSYLQYVYVGAGVTNRTWTVTMPNAGGSYEFRLYQNGSYTIAATSPAVAVTQDIRGTYALSSTLTQTSCTNAARNGTISFPGTLTVTTQTGGTFSGSATLSTTQSGITVTTQITLSGTVLPTASNNVSGQFSYDVTENGVLTRSGNGTLAGTAIPNRLTLTVDAQDSSFETCHIAGPITATK